MIAAHTRGTASAEHGAHRPDVDKARSFRGRRGRATEAATASVTEVSLGYYLTPLFNVLLGVVVLRERLSPGQWFALSLAPTVPSLAPQEVGDPGNADVVVRWHDGYTGKLVYAESITTPDARVRAKPGF